LRMAAQRCFADAQFKLGLCYLEGWSLQKDLNKALEWLRKAADQGNIEAQKKLEKLDHEGKV